MAAIGDSTIRVFPSSEPKLSYFSQYHAIVCRSIWEPLAPGFVSGARDLAGRIVILTTALAGYLIAALFSIRFWCSPPSPPLADHSIPSIYPPLSPPTYISLDRPLPEEISAQLCDPHNPDDIYTAPHTHHQVTQPALPLFKERILKLCDPQNLREEDCVYEGDLNFEKKRIHLLMQDPKIERLVKYISKMAQVEKEAVASNSLLRGPISDLYPQTNTKRYALAALFVFLGIKPALVIEYLPDKELITHLLNLVPDYPNLCYKPFFPNSSKGYFVNEHPFSSFDPRNFLNLSSQISLMDAVDLCWFLESNSLRNWRPAANQFLAYLLGFGPTWEAFEESPQSPVQCYFNKNHYYEIGKVLNQSVFNKNANRSEIEDLGFAYHSQIALLQAGRFEESNVCEKLFYKTGTRCFVGGLAARTEYCKKSYTLKKWVMETYFSQLL